MIERALNGFPLISPLLNELINAGAFAKFLLFLVVLKWELSPRLIRPWRITIIWPKAIPKHGPNERADEHEHGKRSSTPGPFFLLFGRFRWNWFQQRGQRLLPIAIQVDRIR